MPTTCKSIGCCRTPVPYQDFCEACLLQESNSVFDSLSDQYPDHYKSVGDLSEIDAHAVHHIFGIPDPSGCLQQASLRLLMLDSSTHRYQDIKEARDLLTRWLQLNKELLS